MKTYTIQEITKSYDIPASTLRYYEDIGLLTEVGRTSNNQRIYNDCHIGQLQAINCFKRTGMPIAQIQEFFALSQDMEHNIDKIVTLIHNHERSIQQQLAKMKDDLAHIRHKAAHYQGIREAIQRQEPWPRWEDCDERYNEKIFDVFNAVSEAFPMILTANLTKNKYSMIKHDNFLSFDLPQVGCYDDVIDHGVENIHPNYQETFIRCFSRENLLQSFSQGKTDVYAELYQKSHDNKFQWVSTHVIRTKNQDGDICHICINRVLDDIQEQHGGTRR